MPRLNLCFILIWSTPSIRRCECHVVIHDAYCCRSMTGAGSGLKETLEADLHLEKHPFATGWSGNVVRGRYEDQDVAVKLALVPSNRADVSILITFVWICLSEHFKMYSY